MQGAVTTMPRERSGATPTPEMLGPSEVRDHRGEPVGGVAAHCNAYGHTWIPPDCSSLVKDASTLKRQGYRSEPQEEPDAGAGSRTSHPLREPRARLAELSVARAGRGAGRLQSAARTRQIPGHRRLQPERVLYGPRGQPECGPKRTRSG